MTTLLSLKTEVLTAIARDDTEATAWAVRGINAGILAAGLLYEPPELRTTGSLTALTAVDRITTNTLTRLLRIEDMYNETGACPVKPIKYHLRHTLWLPTTGFVQYYSLYGTWAYFNPTPAVEETLTVAYLGYPASLVADGDSYPYSTYEDFVLAFGTAVAFTFMEETESADAWLKIGNQLGVAENVISIVRRVVKGELDLDNIQRVIQQGSASA